MNNPINPSKTNRRLTRAIVSLYFLILFLEGVVSFFFIIQTPSEAGQGVIFGFSAQRLFLALLTTLFFVFFLFIAVLSWKDSGILEKLRLRLQQPKVLAKVLIFTTLLAVIFTMIAFLIPEYRFASLSGYVNRLRPIILWLTLASIQTVFFLVFISGWKVPKIKRQVAFLVFFSIFVLLWVFIALSGLGINADDRYWNEAGVPVLNEQVFIAIVSGVIFLLFSSYITKKVPLLPFLALIYKKRDTFIFITLWIIAAIFWINKPLPRNFFAPGPYLPNHELSPYADSAAFDIGGQFSIIGQGLFNGEFYARALLPGFLALLHSLVGQNYLSVVTLQTAIFASLVPILYLIGKSLHSRTAGILISILFIFKGINAIESSTWILSVHPKYLLTEFPTAIMLTLFTLWFIKWQKKGDEKEYLLVLSGGALGLGIMLRTNILFFIPLAILFIFLKHKVNWMKTLRPTFIFLLAFFIAISPWMWRNQKIAHKPFFFLDILEEVIRTRYSLEPAENISSYLQPQKINLTEQTPKRSRSTLTDFSSIDNDHNYHSQLEFSSSSLSFVPNHFLHNIVTSVLILPTSFIFHDLSHSIKDIYPYWNKINKQWWNGQLTWAMKLGLLWNLLLLALGVSIAWEKWRIAGIVPLLVFFTYHLSNGFARTSGGRYLVPVDWVVLLYYVLGITELLFFCSAVLGFDIKNKEKDILYTRSRYKTDFLYILPFFLFVSTITLMDQAIPQRYPALNPTQIQDRFIRGDILEKVNISEQELNTFLESPNVKTLIGRNLYPRFYAAGEGEHSMGKDAYEDKGFSRLAFTMIGLFGQTGVVLPLNNSPVYFPNATDVIIIGCQHPGEGYLFPYIDALVVVVLGEDQRSVYTREPLPPLECPISTDN